MDKQGWRPDDWQKADETPPKTGKKSWAELKAEWEKITRQGRPSGQGPKQAPISFAKRLKRWGLRGLIFLLVGAALLLLSTGLFLVQEGESGYVLQFGKIVRVVEHPGLHMHWPIIQSAGRVTAKMMLYDVSPSEVLTKDKKAMIVDSYALWRIEDVTRFTRSVGSIQEVQKRIDASVYSNIKNIMGKLNQNEIISDEGSSRDSLNENITKEVSSELKGYGVGISRVEIRRYDLPEDNLAAVHKRMISERRQMAARYKADGEKEAAKIRNMTDKLVDIKIGEAKAEVERLGGEAEKEYMQILREIYDKEDRAAFFHFMMELDALESSLQGQKTLILGPESTLTKLISQAD